MQLSRTSPVISQLMPGDVRKAIMDLGDKLYDIYEQGFEDEGASLSPDDLPLYLAWDFILKWEMGGMSGFMYNTLPDLEAIDARVKALKSIGLVEVSEILDKAKGLFEDYEDSEEFSTWEDVLDRYDPGGVLEGIDDEIGEIDNYGIPS